MPEKIYRIALIGPESTGKTTLCRQLAGHYKTAWVPEFARNYMEQLNRKYTLEDILFTAGEQLKSEKELMKGASRFLFADTEFIMAKIWCEDVFKTCPGKILKMIDENKYDRYLLTQPDLPWQADPVRENPDRRDYFFRLYKKELEKRNFLYEIISGSGEARLQQALKLIEKRFGD